MTLICVVNICINVLQSTKHLTLLSPVEFTPIWCVMVTSPIFFTAMEMWTRDGSQTQHGYTPTFLMVRKYFLFIFWNRYYLILDIVEETILNHQHQTIIFEGVDTFATVHLNSKLIATTDNMFVRYEVPIDGLLQVINKQFI